jgi:aquaporin Z
MVMIFAGGHISGAHYNPAVSTAVFVRGKIGTDEYVPYVVAQVLGAVAAAIVVTILGYDPDSTADLAGAGKMLIVEFLFTFDIWIYLIANLAGGAAAAYVFLFVQEAEKATGDVRAEETA